MNDSVIALVIAMVLSVLISVIEVKHQSHANLKSCLGSAFFIYLAVLAVGNMGTTLLAVAAVAKAKLPGPAWFWHAFVGVFGFESLLQNINVTLFDRGVLSIQDWISKARDSAVASAIQSHTTAGFQRAQALANQLKDIPTDELNSYILQYLGADALNELESNAQQMGAHPGLVKALALAHEHPDQAEAIVKALN